MSLTGGCIDILAVTEMTEVEALRVGQVYSAIENNSSAQEMSAIMKATPAHVVPDTEATSCVRRTIIFIVHV